MKTPLRWSKTFLLHYWKLVFRSMLFLAAGITYVYNRIHHTGELFGGFERNSLLLSVIWIIFAVEMVLRFFPSGIESMGCQKQFAKNYRPTGREEVRLQSWKRTAAVFLAWVALNGIFGALYLAGIFDAGIMLLIALAYSVCDMICILFFCPFQTWFMKNKCCGSCRIYNWDYAMMFTPLIFIPHYYTWGLLGVALLLLLVWELAAWLHPERFDEQTNECLSCAHCKEKLCHHKKQLRRFLRKNKERLILKGNAVIEKVKNVTKKK
jgi:hypothetical protein